MNWERHRITAIALVLLAIPPLFFAPSVSYLSRIFILMVIYATLAMALNIVFGHTDQLLLFTGATAGIGAYTTALAAQTLGISPWVTLLAGALLTGVIGSLVCYVSAIRDLTVIVISILTLALQISIIELIEGARDVTGGVTGLSFTGLHLPAVQNALGLTNRVVLFYTVSALLLGVLVLYRYLMNSKYGLAFEMIRQDEVAAESAGLDVVRYKTFAGFVATFIMGLTGPFLAQLSEYMTPGMFTFNAIDVLILIILVVGGLRTMTGPLVGAVLLVFLNQQLSDFAQFRAIFFGALLIALFLYFRNGMVRYADDVLEQRGIKERIADLR